MSLNLICERLAGCLTEEAASSVFGNIVAKFLEISGLLNENKAYLEFHIQTFLSDSCFPHDVSTTITAVLTELCLFKMASVH